MRFGFPFLEVLTLPTDAGPTDDRIVIDGPNATISFYKGATLFGTLTTAGGVPGFFIFGTDGSQVELDITVTTGKTAITNFGPGGAGEFTIKDTHIETDTVQAAAGPVGAVNGKLEIFDTAGASIGFIPIYATIT